MVLHGYVECKNATASPTGTTKAKPTTATKSAATSATTPATTKQSTEPKQPGSDREARGKRTLEFGNFGNGNGYNYYQTVPAHTAQRRVSHAYQDPGQYNHYQSNYIQPQQYSFQHQHSGSALTGSSGGFQGKMSAFSSCL